MKFLTFLISFIILFFNINTLVSSPLIHLSEGDSINVVSDIEISENYEEETDINKLIVSSSESWHRAGRNDMILYKEPGIHLWTRFDLLNDTETEREVFIKIKEFVLDQVNCYVVYDKNNIAHFKSGIKKPLNEKIIKTVDSIFPIELKKGEKVSVYIDVKADIFTAFYISIYTTNGIFDHSSRPHE